VIAPSKTPRAAGERIKTDRRDAEWLVRLLTAGSLSVVGVPAVEVEAVRDLVRSRACWTKQHRLWLADQRWDHTASELAYLDYLAAVDGLVSRRQAIDGAAA
jgi:transposase